MYKCHFCDIEIEWVKNKLGVTQSNDLLFKKWFQEMSSVLHYRTTEFSVKEKRIGSKNTLHLENVSRIAKYNTI